MQKLLFVLAVGLLSSGCVFGYRHRHGEAAVRVGHHHGRGHAYGHVHGHHCGHAFVDGVWIVVK